MNIETADGHWRLCISRNLFVIRVYRKLFIGVFYHYTNKTYLDKLEQTGLRIVWNSSHLVETVKVVNRL